MARGKGTHLGSPMRVARCPDCGRERGVQWGVFIEHYDGTFHACGEQAVLCPGSGKSAPSISMEEVRE